MVRAPTRLVTLNRLVGVSGIEDAAAAIALDDTDHDGTERMRVTADTITVGDHPALWCTFQTESAPAAWAQDAEVTLGRPVDIREQHSGGVLVIDVDDRLHAISFGQGWRRIQDGYRDQRFGLRVAIRCLDAQDLGEILRRRPGRSGTDGTLTPAGAPLWLRPGDLGAVVRRIGDRTLPMRLTYQPPGDRAPKLLGSSGLRLRLGLKADDLIRDIRTIAEIHDRPLPLLDLAFLDDVAPVSDARTRRQLDADLEDILSDPDQLRGATGNLAVSVPDAALDHLDETASYRIHVGGVVDVVPDLTLDDIARAVRDVPTGSRVAALTRGQIAPCEQAGGRRQLVRPAALTWIEATAVIGDRHFALLDGEWHEFDADFARRVRREVDAVFAAPTTLDLPARPAGRSGNRDDEHAPGVEPGFLRLDRGPGPELCDLLGPGNELVHVQRAGGSSALGHLFARGLVGWQSLRGQPETRRRFRDMVEEVQPGRLPEDWVPDRVVLALRPGTGRPLTPQSLFPFAQAALARTAAELRDGGARLDVVAVTSAADARPGAA